MRADFEEDLNDLKDEYPLNSFKIEETEYAISAVNDDVEIHYTISKHIVKL